MENETNFLEAVKSLDNMSRTKRIATVAGGWAIIGCIVYTGVSITKKVVEAVTTEVIEEIV